MSTSQQRELREIARIPSILKDGTAQPIIILADEEIEFKDALDTVEWFVNTARNAPYTNFSKKPIGAVRSDNTDDAGSWWKAF